MTSPELQGLPEEDRPPQRSPQPQPAARLSPPSNEEELDLLWSRLQDVLRAKIEREQFETWFRRATLRRADGEEVCIAVQNGFTRDWLQSYYREVLEQAVEQVFGACPRLEFAVDPELIVPRRRPAGEPIRPREPAPALVEETRSPELLLSSDSTLNPGYTFDNFVVGPCNRFAHAAALGVSEAPGSVYNPLFLHGSVGLGKTHLMQSLCHTVLERDPRKRILYLSCETFVNHFIGALENGDINRFRTKYRSVDLIVVDDIHVLANKERTQEEFFHTFNTLYNAGKQIVLSSDSPPKDIPTLQNRLVSRFKWGLVTEIEPPCYETRMAILKRKSRERGRELPDDVAAMLAERIDSNIRELEGAVTKVLGYASLSGRQVGVDLARDCLRDVFTARRGEPSTEDILRVVTEHFGVKLSELQSRRRTQAIAFPRQIGMYLARKITRLSLEEIGGFFGGRDHSTVLYGVHKIEKLAKKDPTYEELLRELEARIQQPEP